MKSLIGNTFFAIQFALEAKANKLLLLRGY